MWKQKKPSEFFLDFAFLVIFLVYFLLIRKMPLISTFGVESANLLTIIFGPLLAIWAAFCAYKQEDKNFFDRIKNRFMRLFFYLCFLAGLFYLNGLLIKSCSPGNGAFAFFVMLLPPLLLNISIGVFLSFLPTKYLKIILFILCYGFYYFLEAFLWLKEPYFRIFTHLSLAIPSDLISGISLNAGMLEFRIATLIFALAFNCFFAFLITKNDSKNFSLLFLSVLLAACGYYFQSYAFESLGKNKQQLLHDYSLILQKNFITIKANPYFTSRTQAENILDESLLWQKRLEKRIGFTNKKEVTVWLHDNDEQILLYTGAKNVQFALPSKREIHISKADIPHNVLGHELSHIFLGDYSTHSLKIIGPNRLVPNFALTEGLAMALTPEESIYENLDLITQAQALFQAGIKVNIEKLFSPYNSIFISTSPRIAYIYSGAFLTFCLQEAKNPQAIVKNFARLGSLKALEDEGNVEKIIQQFTDKLNDEIPHYALTWANTTFKGAQSILTKSCTDPYSKEKEDFAKLMVENKPTQAIATLNKLPSKEKTLLLLNKARELAEKQEISSAQTLLIYALKDESNDYENIFIQIKILLAKLFIYQEKYQSALETIEKINQNMLTQSAARQILAANILLRDCIQNNNNFSKSALSLLMGFYFEEASPTLLSYYASHQSMDSQANILSYYIFFKSQVFLKNNYSLPERAADLLIPHITTLYAVFQEEFYFTLGKMYLETKNKEKSMVIFSKLLQDTTNNALKIKYTDYLERSLSL